MSKYKARSQRTRRETPPSPMEGKLFMQLLICAALVCGFMFFKDTPLPGGKTPAQYASHFLVYTVKIDDLLAKIKDFDSVPASGNAIETSTPSPVTASPAPVSPAPTPAVSTPAPSI